jgi:YjbE family integral membrane protein
MFHDVTALVQVIFADIVLAGDNAVAVGLAATALSPDLRRRAIMIGIALALILRIGFALVAVQLLAIKGLLLLGGLLLLWVAWRMWKDIQSHESSQAGMAEAEAREGTASALNEQGLPSAGGVAASAPAPAENAAFARALLSIVVADVSMSLDNVLVVAAVARHSPEIMAFGLVLSVVLMGVAASLIAGVINKYRWIAYVGLAVIVFAAIRMIWEDSHHFWPDLIPQMPGWLGAGSHPPPVEP